MDDKDFQKLLTGVRQMKSILAGKTKPARSRAVTPVRRTRLRMKLTQRQFAELFGLPLTTVRNWEQGRTEPDAAARALLKVADKRPDAVLEALHASA